MNDYETDNFAYIISVIEKRKEQRRRLEESWREFDEAQRRSAPYCRAIVLLVFMLIFALAWRDGSKVDPPPKVNIERRHD